MIILIPMLEKEIIVISQKKYRGSSHRNCDINVKLSYKFPVVFQKPKKLGFASYYTRTR